MHRDIKKGKKKTGIKSIETTVLTQKQIISTSKRLAEHPFVGQNTKQAVFVFRG